MHFNASEDEAATPVYYDLDEAAIISFVQCAGEVTGKSTRLHLVALMCLYMCNVALQTRIEGYAARPRLCSARDEDLALVRGLLHVAIDV